MLKDNDGRSYTRLTPADIKKKLAREYKSLSKAQRRVLGTMLAEFADTGGKSSSLQQALRMLCYKREPVDMRTFVLDPYYLGDTCANIFPKLLDDLEEIFSADYNEIIFTGAIGVGKCVAAGTVVSCVETGRRRPVESWVGGDFRVHSYAHDHGGAVCSGSAEAMASGHKVCGELRLANGKSVRVSLDHPILTPTGWKEAAEIRSGDLVAALEREPEPAQTLDVSDAEVRWYGNMVVGGLFGSQVYLSHTENQTLDMKGAVRELSRVPPAQAVENTTPDAWERTTRLQMRGVEHLCEKWRTESGLHPYVFQLPTAQLRLLVHRIVARWGSFTPDGVLIRGNRAVLRDLQDVLVRFGVHSRLGTEPGPGEVPTLYVEKAEDVTRYVEEVGAFCDQENLAYVCRHYVNRGLIPARPRPRTAWKGDGVVWVRVVDFDAGTIAEPVYDVSVPGVGSFVANGVVVHNTFASSIGICRVLYELSCMADPHEFYGLTPETPIILAGISANEDLAREVVLKNVIGKIAASPYFQENFPFRTTMKNIRFKDANVMVVARATTPTSMLGMSVLAALIDEGNFMPRRQAQHGKRHGKVDMAKTIYDTAKRRMFSRYGNLGRLFLPSSKATVDSFVDERIRAARTDPSIFVRDYCLSGDTEVPLLDGTTSTLAELAEKYAGSDARFWVYSFDTESGRIVPGAAYRPRLTASDEETLIVTLDNGEEVVATPWHPFMMKDGTYRRADELCAKDGLKSRSEAAVCVSSVRPGPRVEVYDLSVETYENFALGAGIFVHNSLWDVKPDDFADTTFPVLCGNEQINSKILTPEEAVAIEEDPPERTFLIHVPDNLRPEFESDLEGSIRDLAGMATVAMSPFIQRVEKIQAMVDVRTHPMTSEVFDPALPIDFRESEMVTDRIFREYDGTLSKMRVPIINPDAPRAIHIDPALNHCASGFCMGHVAGLVSVDRMGSRRESYTDMAPMFVVDLILKIVPPSDRDLDFSLYERLIVHLAEMGYPIRKVTADQYQSEYLLQRLSRMGYEVGKVSMDRTWDPYQLVKQVIYEERVRCYPYEPLFQELRTLEADWAKRRIEKAQNGSKDVADALAGCLYTLNTMRTEAPVPLYVGSTSYGQVEDDIREELALMGGGVAIGGLASMHPEVLGSITADMGMGGEDELGSFAFTIPQRGADRDE